MADIPFVLKPRMRTRLAAITGDEPELFLFVNITSQLLLLINNQCIASVFPVSTSKFGVGNMTGSFKTPPGIHHIIEKIGAGAPEGRIFKDRQDTGIDWTSDMTGENLILTRILRLEGLEPDINKGPGLDSYERYIYIHGTNKEELIGTPMSHGCICMKNKDITELFDTVPEKTLVIID